MDHTTMQSWEIPATINPMLTSLQANSTGDVIMLMSYDQYITAKNVLDTIEYVILPLAVLATLCNIVVFCHPVMRSSTSQYVVALSLAQMVYLLIGIGFHLMMAALRNPVHVFAYFVYGLYGLSYSIAVTRRASYVVMCLVSMERLYAIVRPFHIKSFPLTRFPLVFIAGVFGTTALAHFYIPAMLHIRQVAVTPDGTAMYGMQPSPFYLQNQALVDFFSTATKLIFSFLPIAALLILNLLTLAFLRRHTLRRRAMKTSADDDAECRRQHQMTVTILGATLSYVLLSLPLALQTLISTLDSSYKVNSLQQHLKFFFYFMQSLSYVSVLFSCFTDFLSFFILSTAYRRTFFTLCRLYCPPMQGSSRTMNPSSPKESL